MVITDDLRAASSRSAMGVDEGLRVDFEMDCVVGMDIGCGEDLLDLPAFAQQDATAFVRVRCLRLGEQLVQ